MPESEKNQQIEAINRVRFIKAIRVAILAGVPAAVTTAFVTQDLFIGAVAGGTAGFTGGLTDWFLRPKFDPSLDVNKKNKANTE